MKRVFLSKSFDNLTVVIVSFNHFEKVLHDLGKIK